MTALENYITRTNRIANLRKLYRGNSGELKALNAESDLIRSEFENAQSFSSINLAKVNELVDVYDKALTTYNDVYYNIYYYEINGMCECYEPTDEELAELDGVDIWKNLVLSGKITLIEAVAAELLRFEKVLRDYNEKWRNGEATSVVAVGYQIHIYCSELFRNRVKNWLIEKGLINPSLKGGYDKAYFAS